MSPSQRITKADLLVALSRSLDLVEGQPPGHAARTCLIAQRIADVLGLDERDKNDLYFAALLKDAGCSSNSARIHKIFGGDDFLSKRDVKLIDWSNPFEGLKFAVKHTERGQTWPVKLRRMLGNLGSPTQIMDEVTRARCTRGADIARLLGFNPNIADAILHLDEHWDGRGSPSHVEGPEIPMLARILCLAQTLEVFVTATGLLEGFTMVERRSGTWFDPMVASAALELQKDHELWIDVAERAQDATREIPIPAAAFEAADVEIDDICRAFAAIVDAKSSFTAEHSSRVTFYALEMADAYGFDAERRQTLERAALLHDIGKLGVGSHILEKPGKLTEAEYDAVKLHPKYTWEILSLIPGFGRVTEIAANHHERLDGSGYWRGLSGEQLDLDMRIVAVADVFDALRAKRPYRDALPYAKVMNVLDQEAGVGLDAECIEIMRELYATRPDEAVAA